MAQCPGTVPPDTLSDDAQFSFGAFHRDLLTNTQTLVHAEKITLWVGTGLAEQLLLAWIPQLFRHLEIDLQRLRIIQFSHDPINGEEIQSVGILDPDKLKAHPQAEVLNAGAIACLDQAWSAVTAREPTALVAFLAEEPGPLPFFQKSLPWLLYRFPDAETGLSYLDWALLTHVAETINVHRFDI